MTFFVLKIASASWTPRGRKQVIIALVTDGAGGSVRERGRCRRKPPGFEKGARMPARPGPFFGTKAPRCPASARSFLTFNAAEQQKTRLNYVQRLRACLISQRVRIGEIGFLSCKAKSRSNPYRAMTPSVGPPGAGLALKAPPCGASRRGHARLFCTGARCACCRILTDCKDF